MRKAFKMFLNPNMKEEYQRRHQQLWPQMKQMIHEYGGQHYSIYFDESTNLLFGILEIEDEQRWAESANTEICQKWWAYMAPLMQTNTDLSPISIDLEEVFYLE